MAKAEKITCEVFRVSGLSIKHSVTFGTKAQDGSRRNAISYFNYKSNKYTNESELATYTINTDDYLIFEKMGKDKEDKENRKDDAWDKEIKEVLAEADRLINS